MELDIQTIGELAHEIEFEIRRLFGREWLEEIKHALAAWKTPERPTDLDEFDGDGRVSPQATE